MACATARPRRFGYHRGCTRRRCWYPSMSMYPTRPSTVHGQHREDAREKQESERGLKWEPGFCPHFQLSYLQPRPRRTHGRMLEGSRQIADRGASWPMTAFGQTHVHTRKMRPGISAGILPRPDGAVGWDIAPLARAAGCTYRTRLALIRFWNRALTKTEGRMAEKMWDELTG